MLACEELYNEPVILREHIITPDKAEFSLVPPRKIPNDFFNLKSVPFSPISCKTKPPTQFSKLT